MSEPIATIINSGESSNGTSEPRLTGVEERTSEPKTLVGYDVEEPDTEPIRTGNSGGGTTRITKSGRIDRRTKAGRTIAGTDSGESATEAKESVHLSRIDLADAIYSLHLTLSGITGIEELELEKDEAKDLAKASTELAKHYAVNFDPKKVALFNFCCALGKVYIPRAIIIKNNRKKKGPQLAPAPATVPKQQVNGPPAFSPEVFGGAADLEP
jgi:hypothetical protein